jgi:hypothetical protein
MHSKVSEPLEKGAWQSCGMTARKGRQTHACLTSRSHQLLIHPTAVAL